MTTYLIIAVVALRLLLVWKEAREEAALNRWIRENRQALLRAARRKP